MLIISICNAAGCWGSHSHFLCQCAKTAQWREGRGKTNCMEERETANQLGQKLTVQSCLFRYFLL